MIDADDVGEARGVAARRRGKDLFELGTRQARAASVAFSEFKYNLRFSWVRRVKPGVTQTPGPEFNIEY